MNRVLALATCLLALGPARAVAEGPDAPAPTPAGAPAAPPRTVGEGSDAAPSTAADTAAKPPTAAPGLERLLADAAEADWALRTAQDCAPERLQAVQAAVEALDALWDGPRVPATAWRYPVARVSPDRSIGGANGNGFHRGSRLACYAGRNAGHPAHDLFVDDPDGDWLDDDGRPWTAHAIEPGYVLVARTGWLVGDAARGGNYVMLYLPTRRAVAYYAHLDRVDVTAGERVDEGAVLGTVGRTGLNAWKRRSPTHLHFGLWEGPALLPTNPYPLLAKARRHEGASATASSGTGP